MVGACSCRYLRSQGGSESCEAPSSGPGLLLALGASGTSLLTDAMPDETGGQR